MKINAYCPANIKLVIAKDKKCSVQHMETHIGHDVNENELCHLTLTKVQRQNLAARIAAKIPFDDILDEVRNSICGEELKIIHLLTKQDLLNIENAFNLGGHESRHKNDACSVDALVEEFKDHVLFYKPQTTISENYPDLNTEDFMLIIMNEHQSEMLMKFSGDCVCIDGTHGLNAYGFELITLMVIDDLRQGLPCAFLITNRTDYLALNVFFSCVKLKIGILQPKIFMSDMAESFFNAWLLSMGTPEKRLFCSWHVDHAWRRNLSKVKTKEKQVEVYHLLRTLLQETDKFTFDILIKEVIEKLLDDPDTYDFGRYFVENYSKNIQYWAYCFRLHCGINTNMHMENMHRTIKYIYLNGKNNKRLDKCINTLMNLIKNKLFDRLITLHKGKLSSKLKLLRARHASSLDLDLASVCKTSENGIWFVNSSKNTLDQYIVRKQDSDSNNCSCKLICDECSCCIHNYTCSCLDNCIKWNMCKHIHLVSRFLKFNSSPIAEDRLNNQSEEGNLTIHIPENASAMDESKSIVSHLSNKKITDSLEMQQNDLINHFIQLVHKSDTQEAIDIIKKQLVVIDSKLKAMQVLKEKSQEFNLEIQSQTSNKKIEPQRRLFSTKKKIKSKNKIAKPTTSVSEKIALSLILNKDSHSES